VVPFHIVFQALGSYPTVRCETGVESCSSGLRLVVLIYETLGEITHQTISPSSPRS